MPQTLWEWVVRFNILESENTDVCRHGWYILSYWIPKYRNTKCQVPVYIEFLNPVVNILAKLHISVCRTATFILVCGDVDPEVTNAFLGILMCQMQCYYIPCAVNHKS